VIIGCISLRNFVALTGGKEEASRQAISASARNYSLISGNSSVI